MTIVMVHNCELGRHELKPRFDFAKVGEVVKRTYICEVCTICGHQVPRPLTMKDRIDAGVVTPDEIREAMRMAVVAGFPATEEVALQLIVARGKSEETATS